MFGTLRTLVIGANARADDQLRDTFAVELIDQKVREAEAALRAAKTTLAALIQRQRSEQRQYDGLQKRIIDLTNRAQAALDANNDAMAMEAANAVATMENEAVIRSETLSRLEAKVMRLRSSVEAGHRRIIDLKQGALQAKSVTAEAKMQSKLRQTLHSNSSAEEAQEMIARVLQRDDPFEQAQILDDINGDLDASNLTDRMADAGYGDATRVTASAVLERLKSKK
ncbi:PspA/IM30 family protein [Algirhabdus cladophorae]|uniref:PspA/IM30 family protein n=1 Tax=Algirhabdus cladophorae TaxID=3377108 RepID=UPI003B845CCC